MNKATATNTGHKLPKVPEMVFGRGRLHGGNFGNGAACHAIARGNSGMRMAPLDGQPGETD